MQDADLMVSAAKAEGTKAPAAARATAESETAKVRRVVVLDIGDLLQSERVGSYGE